MQRTARGSARKGPARNVQEYLAALPADARAALVRLRKMIRAAAPTAEEGISYRVPMYKHGGPLVAFAAFEEHCSFFVMSPAVMAAHKAALKPYKTSKGTIRFPAAKPLPARLVTKLVKARIAENEARVKRKSARA